MINPPHATHQAILGAAIPLPPCAERQSAGWVQTSNAGNAHARQRCAQAFHQIPGFEFLLQRLGPEGHNQQRGFLAPHDRGWQECTIEALAAHALPGR
jgi:hypothetical protein